MLLLRLITTLEELATRNEIEIGLTVFRFRGDFAFHLKRTIVCETLDF